MTLINYEDITAQLKKELNSDCAIANKYGIVLASNIKEFSKGKIIPEKILTVVLSSQEIAEELNLRKINTFAVESENFHYLFTFSKDLILVSRLNLEVNLAKYMPSISVFLERLTESSQKQDIKEFSTFDFSKEISKIEESMTEDKSVDEKYSIIKDLVNYVSK
jgi:hypothetical protein